VAGRHRVARSRPAPTAGLVEQLSEREMAVLRYLPSALSLPEIARELYVSPNTVKTQCNAIYRKLAVTSRRAAVQAARERHLL
jgi:LuxR family maltose regulon positive regulatory protein